ncbi:MAG: hypothetical protein KDA60_17100 [Planctomycetales bacterium]|nr:hypothetical protein [Planctomycetales bacterium]
MGLLIVAAMYAVCAGLADRHLWGQVAPSAPTQTDSTHTAAEIDQSIRNLADRSFQVRERATRNLVGRGTAAVPYLVAAAEQSDREMTRRILYILAQLAGSRDRALREIAEAAVAELSKSTDTNVSTTATQVLDHLIVDRQKGIVADLEDLGADVNRSSTGRGTGARVVVSLTSDWHGSPQDMRRLAQYPGLKELQLFGPAITDDYLRDCERWESLVSLQISRTNITDQSLTRIGRLTQLVELDLSRSSISDAGIEQLQALANLESLVLYDTWVTDASLVTILRFTKLHRLSLAATRITSLGFAQLAQLEYLEWVDASRTQFDRRSLVAILAKSNSLRHVVAQNSGLHAMVAENVHQQYPQVEILAKRISIRQTNR